MGNILEKERIKNIKKKNNISIIIMFDFEGKSNIQKYIKKIFKEKVFTIYSNDYNDIYNYIKHKKNKKVIINSSNIKDIESINEVINPDIYLILNNILNSDKKTNKYLKKINQKTLIINYDKLGNIKQKNLDIYRCGTNKYDDIYAYDIDEFKFKINYNNFEYEILNYDKKEYIYILASITIGLLYGIDIKKIVSNLNN